MLALQHKRGQRSRQSFLLMLLKLKAHLPVETRGKVLGEILSVLASSTRETDVAGWYEEKSVAGVLFMEINLDRPHPNVGPYMPPAVAKSACAPDKKH